MMLLAALCFVWTGMVLGISFLETPVKFTAPSVTLPIGLDVGLHVFGAFNKVEIGGVLLACGLLVGLRPQLVSRVAPATCGLAPASHRYHYCGVANAMATALAKRAH